MGKERHRASSLHSIDESWLAPGKMDVRNVKSARLAQMM
jgi:hypothetical protein